LQKLIFSTRKRKKKYLLRALCWLAVLLYMAGMFYFSNQNGTQSNKISEEIVAEIIQHVPLNSILEEKNFIQRLDYNYILRKCSHFIEYFILALMVYFALRICGVRPKTTTLITFTFCIIYASLDEYHQSFVIERTPALKDVIVDVSGGILALTILFIRRLSKRGIRQEY
jgi:VanZ family protein